MRILLIHSYYQQRGGEDAVVETERDLLKQHNHEVYLYERSNKEIEKLSVFQKIEALLNMHWSKQSYGDICDAIRKFKPDVCHVYNTFFMVTPSVYDACRKFKVPVVQSLYNYRLVCANALFLRNKKNCEDCLTKSRIRSIFFSCYRDSPFLTALVVRMINSHWKEKAWIKSVGMYITPTEFSRKKFVEAGIPPEKITVKPQFVLSDLGKRTGDGSYALYIGRLSAEKGVHVLLKAWESITEIPLKVMGGGPLSEEVKQWVKGRKMRHVEVLGYCPEEEYLSYLKGAKFLVIPSISYDNFPRLVAEAYACGVPILASDVGGLKECIREDITGKIFKSDDANDLAGKARWFAKNSDSVRAMGENARKEFETKYNAQKNYDILMAVYEQAIKARND